MFNFLWYFSCICFSYLALLNSIFIVLFLFSFTVSLFFFFFYIFYYWFQLLFYYWFSTLITSTTVHFIFSHTAGEISSPAMRKLHWWQAQWTTTDNWSLISCCNQLLWNTSIIFLFVSHSRIHSGLMVIFSLNFTNCFGFYFLLFKGKIPHYL